MNRKDGRLELVNRDVAWMAREGRTKINRSIGQQARRAMEEIRRMARRAVDDIWSGHEREEA